MYFGYKSLADLRSTYVTLNQELNDGKKMNSAYDQGVPWLQKFSARKNAF